MLNRPQLIMPGPGRPRWVAASPESPLLYLGWGERDFHARPLPMHPKVGWSYSLIRSGSARLMLPGRQTHLNAGTFLIAAPQCLFGLTHEPGESCDLRVWIWQAPPTIERLAPAGRDHLLLSLSDEALQEVERIHGACRREVARPDEWTRDVFTLSQRQIDVTLARLSSQTSTRESELQRLGLAEQWMRANLAARNPVVLLCEYLQVSPNTLHKLFRRHFDTSPGAYHQRLKLAEARRLIDAEGWLVKQAAYHLGYRHANDLSRALAKSSPRPLPGEATPKTT